MTAVVDSTGLDYEFLEGRANFYSFLYSMCHRVVFTDIY